ncbi:anti-sigma factor family protein [Rariglobus hedericola]|uniref:Uncharacterized protein n=1 Tax=Rariglobus hedericola TaxID=2597822 RepID=A0A556QNP8_9BACT|nr:hypothetical protein [Rariglobus hedericola]TSJ78265.1 hypothetical protein FPL22_02880 [Rariglobus hedericola]
MNDRRFIELLNLYVDHQIDPSEAAELEAEVLRNPSRRRAYDQYCRLQRGCSLLGAHARSAAPASQGFARSVRDAERKIAAPRRAVPIWRTAYSGAFATAAMAACVVVIVVVNRQSSAPDALASEQVLTATSNQEPVAATVAPVVVASNQAPSVPAMSATGPSAFEFQPVMTAAALTVARTPREAEIASNDRDALEWMQRVDALQLSRVVVDEQAFEARPTLQPDNRVFRSRHSLQGNNSAAEFTAFQFQR